MDGAPIDWLARPSGAWIIVQAAIGVILIEHRSGAA